MSAPVHDPSRFKVVSRAPRTDADGEELGEHMILQMGPAHPVTHGVVQMTIELDGETIKKLDVEIGYLHRAFEKMCEQMTWNQVLPYTDRLNYISPLLNNVGYVMAVEKLIGLEVPPRCQWIRMMIGEMSRITDHLTCVGAGAMELAAFTPFLYAVKAREVLFRHVEKLCGARLTTSYTRVGGLAHDLPPNYCEELLEILKNVEAEVVEVDKMLTRNRIFVDRLVGVGKLSRELALEYGVTGPFLRSTGVDYDVRKDAPYMYYDQVDFAVPVGSHGDNYDRYLCRLEEIVQSRRILEQIIPHLQEPGPVNAEDWRYVLPPKQEVYNSIEGMMGHFKIIMHGIPVPAGEAYGYTEAANGELGFHVISNGEGSPYRVRCRGPCFAIMQALPPLLEGGMIADIVPTFDSVNMIAGEMDR
jgi:NADH-quinone oxidoreductase subunit D